MRRALRTILPWLWPVLWLLLSGPVNAADTSRFDPGGEETHPRAQLRARLQTILAAPISARILTLDVEEGDRVGKGARIASLDCADHRAGLQAARARRSAALAKRDAHQRLKALESGSALDLDLAEAELAAAEADINRFQAILTKCEIRAPFAGLITVRPAMPFQYISEGQPMVELTSVSELEMEMVVPAAWLQWLENGAEFRFRVDATGEVAVGRVRTVGGRVDPVSQTLRVIGVISAKEGRHLLPGLSGSVIFPGRP